MIINIQVLFYLSKKKKNIFMYIHKLPTVEINFDSYLT